MGVKVTGRVLGVVGRVATPTVVDTEVTDVTVTDEVVEGTSTVFWGTVTMVVVNIWGLGVTVGMVLWEGEVWVVEGSHFDILVGQGATLVPMGTVVVVPAAMDTVLGVFRLMDSTVKIPEAKGTVGGLVVTGWLFVVRVTICHVGDGGVFTVVAREGGAGVAPPYPGMQSGIIPRHDPSGVQVRNGSPTRLNPALQVYRATNIAPNMSTV